MKKDIIEKHDLVIKYYQTINDYCYAILRDKDIADEITQEVIEIFLNEWSYKKNPNAEAWLKITASHKISEYRRSIGRKKRYEDSLELYDEADIGSTEDNYFEMLELKNIENILIKTPKEVLHQYILNHLKGATKLLYQSLYIDKISNEEILKELNLSEYAFKMRRTRLKKKVRGIVKNYLKKFEE